MPTLIWVDLRVKKPHMNFYIDLSGACYIHRVDSAVVVSEAIQRIAPDVLCFDYDYPDLSGLKALRETKLNHPELPIIMLIEQRSEALAVWAFRTGVRDYVAKPVNSQTLYSEIELLIKIPIAQGGPAYRENYLPPPLIPAEARVGQSIEVRNNTLPAISYVNNHFHEKVTLEGVAGQCGMGTFQFSRAFKREHGLTFQEYLLRYRIDQARELLKNPRVSIVDSAFAVGFNDPSYFARLFKRYVGLSPSQYRLDVFYQVSDKEEREAAGSDRRASDRRVGRRRAIDAANEAGAFLLLSPSQVHCGLKEAPGTLQTPRRCKGSSPSPRRTPGGGGIPVF